MISSNVAMIGIAGIIGGLFSHWILRIEKQITPFYKTKVKEKFIPALATLTDLIIGLLMILLIYLLIS